jgi:signal peptidase I
MRKWRTIAVSMLSLALLAGCSGAKPESTVEEFFTAGQQLDAEAMAETTLSSVRPLSAKTVELPLDESNTYLLEYFKKNADKISFEVTNTAVEDDRAMVTVDAKYLDGVPLIKATISSVLLKMSSLEFNGTEATEEVNHIFADTIKEQMEVVPETYIEKTLKINLVREDNKWYIVEITDEMLDVAMSGFMTLSDDLFYPFQVVGDAMVPTLYSVNRLMLINLPEVDRFDIVVFPAPDGTKEEYVKRVIGLPGDEITYFQDELYINGEKVEEHYLEMLKEDSNQNLTGDFTLFSLTGEAIVPQDMYFVLGDNRNVSKDSRVLGFIPAEQVKGFISAAQLEGTVDLGVWPLNKIGIVTDNGVAE